MAASRMRGVWFLLACCATLSGASHAAAEPFVVEWQAPACAHEAVFQARVRDALRREPELALERELRVEVRIQENPEKAGFSLSIGMGAGKRELELPSCEEAVAAAATIVALAIDPNAVVPTVSAPTPAEPTTANEPAVRTLPKPRAVSSPTMTAHGPEPYVAAFGGVSVGDVPTLSPLIGGSIGLRLRSLGVAAEGFWIASQSGSVPGTNKGGEIGLWGGGVSGCYLVPQRWLRLSGCLMAQAGVWHSRGEGVTTPTEQSDWWLGVGARLGATARLGSAAGLYFAADLVVPARRPWFEVAGVGRVFRPKVATERFSAGVELSF